MNVTQEEYRVARQNGRIIHTKINILNFDFQTVSEISGVVLEGATFSVDATSDIRRTCSISLIPKDNSFNIEYGGKLWMDKYIQIFIGIEDIKGSDNIIYSNMGIYLINNPEQVYDATNNTVTINGVDLMAKITGLRNGYLEGITYQIPMNSGIKQVMTTVIKDECGFGKYSIDQPAPTILTPYEMSFGLGSTEYNIISQLRDINANYQTYFDVDGIFWFNPIPSGYNEQVMVDDDIWNKVLISYKKSSDFESVKNYIEVFGKTQDNGLTPYGFAADTNPNSPFFIGLNNENRIRIVLNGGEYDNIYPLEDYDVSPVLFNSLAQQRANYELYVRCRLQDQIELTCVPIYWLDVNWLISITLPNKQGTPVQEYYIIKKINTTLGVNGTQSITAMKYYPAYPQSAIIYYGHPITLSNSRFGLAATATSSYALFGGGGNAVDAYNNLLAHSVATRFTYPKWWIDATTVGDYAIFGGGHEGGVDSSGHYIYHPQVDAYNASLTHYTPTAFSIARVRYAATTVGNYALFGGGDYEYATSAEIFYNTVDVYDNSLTKTTTTPLSMERTMLAATTVGNYGLFAGGVNDIYRTARIDVYDSYLTQQSLIYLSVARYHLAATTIGGYAIFGGGRIGASTIVDTVDAFDVSLTRLVLSSLSQPRYQLTATNLNDYAVFGGGWYIKNISTGDYYPTTVVDAYDKSLTRIIPQALSQGRTSVAATTINNYALFGGGYTSQKDTSGNYKSTDIIDVYSTV